MTILTMMKPLKLKTCRVCKVKYTPRTSLQSVCGYDCSLTYTNLLAEKKKRATERLDRKITREKLAKLKTRQQHLRETQKVFNLYIRTRDEKENCICCNRSTNMDTGICGHAWDAGHYRSIGSAPHLRFNENNVHKQLVLCNRYGSGRAVDYRIGLIARIGLEAVETLEADQTPRQYSIDDIIAIKNLYKAKIKELKANGN